MFSLLYPVFFAIASTSVLLFLILSYFSSALNFSHVFASFSADSIVSFTSLYSLYASLQSSTASASGRSLSSTTDSARSLAFLTICYGLKPSTRTIGTGRKGKNIANFNSNLFFRTCLSISIFSSSVKFIQYE